MTEGGPGCRAPRRPCRYIHLDLQDRETRELDQSFFAELRTCLNHESIRNIYAPTQAFLNFYQAGRGGHQE